MEALLHKEAAGDAAPVGGALDIAPGHAGEVRAEEEPYFRLRTGRGCTYANQCQNSERTPERVMFQSHMPQKLNSQFRDVDGRSGMGADILLDERKSCKSVQRRIELLS